MGLDTTHGCWRGPCRAFSDWRSDLAEVAGYRIVEEAVEWDFGGSIHRRTYRCAELDYEEIRKIEVADTGYGGGALFGEWVTTPSDPLVVLLAHADCEGVIHPEQAGPLADRLTDLLPLLPDEGTARRHTQQFIDGLRRAVAAGEDVEFH